MKKLSTGTICVVSLVISIVSLVVSVFRNCTYEFDYPSLLVSVLSIVVTLLIGWNIYSMVDFNRHKKELDFKIALINELTKSMQVMSQMNKGIVEQAISDLYYRQLGVSHPTPIEYSYLNHLISSIIAFTDAGDYETPRILIKSVTEAVVKPELIKLNMVERSGLLSGISLVKNTDRIPNWTDLVDIVARMGKR